MGGRLEDRMPSLALMGGRVRLYKAGGVADFPTASRMLRTSCCSSSSLLGSHISRKIVVTTCGVAAYGGETMGHMQGRAVAAAPDYAKTWGIFKAVNGKT